MNTSRQPGVACAENLLNIYIDHPSLPGDSNKNKIHNIGILKKAFYKDNNIIHYI